MQKEGDQQFNSKVNNLEELQSALREISFADETIDDNAEAEREIKFKRDDSTYLPPFIPYIAPARKWEFQDFTNVVVEKDHVHHWLLDEVDGPTVAAKCKKCGSTTTMRAWPTEEEIFISPKQRIRKKNNTT